MSRIFISYRRGDHPHAAARLALELQRRLPDFEVFIDIDGIRPGEAFGAKLDHELENCAYLLVVVGKKWAGHRRPRTKPSKISDQNDWVRREIVTSLKRKIPVVPICVDGAELPPLHELPEDLRGLHDRQRHYLTHTEFDNQVSGLVSRLLKPPATTASPSRRTNLPEGYITGFTVFGERPETKSNMLPTSPKPILVVGLSRERGAKLLVDWFFENFEDPVNSVPYDGREGGYQYIHVGPYDAREQLEDEFRDVSEEIIDAAVEEIESDGQTEWAPSYRRIVDREA